MICTYVYHRAYPKKRPMLNIKLQNQHFLPGLILAEIFASAPALVFAGKLQAGQVVFVDLAGSERVGKSGVHADGTAGARAFSSAAAVKRWVKVTEVTEMFSTLAQLNLVEQI